jgi:hypothetical protein
VKRAAQRLGRGIKYDGLRSSLSEVDGVRAVAAPDLDDPESAEATHPGRDEGLDLLPTEGPLFLEDSFPSAA